MAQPEANALISELSATVRYFFTSPDGIRHFREVRQLFEGALARHAAKHATAKDIDDLRQTICRCEEFLGRPEEFHRAAESFHSKLAEITGNPVFQVVEEAIAGWSGAARMRTQVANDEKALDAHRRILKAITAGDPDRAEAEMNAHLQERTRTIFDAKKKATAEGG